MTADQTRIEIVYGHALTAVAMGVSRPDTNAWVVANVRDIPCGTMIATLDEAARDALSMGVEREDIDPSWFV